LIAICQLADGDLYADVREIRLGIGHLGSKCLRSDNVVEKWLGSHLDNASDELALGIGVKCGREGVETGLEKVAIVEAALCKQNR
jgi:hypothetical protein